MRRLKPAQASWRQAAYIPLDTTPEAYSVQVEAYRKMGGLGRSEIMFRLIELAREAALAGIRSRHPGYDEDHVHRAYFRLVLGDKTVTRIWPGTDLVKP